MILNSAMRSHVTSQMARASKATIANLAYVRLQTSMRSLMYNSRLFTSKSLVAHVTELEKKIDAIWVSEWTVSDSRIWVRKDKKFLG